MSGIGKGVTTSSIGLIFQGRGWKVSAMKIDPYINVDAGTMNPIEHGEVFVTEDGLESDQDLGNYERFLGKSLHRVNYMTTGAVYQSVIERERNLGYEGKCVQVVPHIPEEVIARIRAAAKHDKADVMMIEIGGTVGEYENLLFLEAARMMRLESPDDVAFVMVSYLPIPAKVGEMKTKPTQHAVRALNSAGIQPDIIIARSEEPMDAPRKKKLSVFCNLQEQDIISAPDIETIYDVPVNFEKDNLGDRLSEKLSLPKRKRDLEEWRAFASRIKRLDTPLRIGVVGKYFATGTFSLSDSYISVIEAIKHGAWTAGRKPVIEWLSAEDFEKNPKRLQALDGYDGIIIPGGFGKRGVEGKIAVIAYARKKEIPIFGLCLGLQMMVIEFARHVAGMRDANTTEVDAKTSHPVIDVMPEQAALIQEHRLGGSMRLGNYPCTLDPKSVAGRAYGTQKILERHRHRYEFNNSYRDKLIAKGLVCSGINTDRNLVEIVELKDHPFFVGTQFHPELASRPLSPHPLFVAFAKAARKRGDARTKKHS